MPGIAQNTAGFSIQNLMRLPSAYTLDKDGSKVKYELLIQRGVFMRLTGLLMSAHLMIA